ncbi:MAG: hypothetical protein ISF22_07020 [Methanomassiliicoccus sp.]|nr:hypothetical protein [Methanomassiliicoccus sp.]
MKRLRFDWLRIAREIGIVLGFVSIFFTWIATDFLVRLEIPLARFIDPSIIWDLLQTWPNMLGPIGGLIFLGGCILLLFTRWGVIVQAIGLMTFASFYLSTYGGEQATLGIGFYIGVISAVIIAATVLIERRTRTPSRSIRT